MRNWNNDRNSHVYSTSVLKVGKEGEFAWKLLHKFPVLSERLSLISWSPTPALELPDSENPKPPEGLAFYYREQASCLPRRKSLNTITRRQGLTGVLIQGIRHPGPPPPLEYQYFTDDEPQAWWERGPVRECPLP